MKVAPAVEFPPLPLMCSPFLYRLDSRFWRCFAAVLAFILTSSPHNSSAQDCSDAADNVLCAENPPIEDSLSATPFAFDCLSVDLSYFFSFTTGTNDGGNAEITIAPGDCDSFIGTDEISMLLLQIPDGADPCDPANYTPVSGCFGDTMGATYNISGLAAESEFILVVGSDHDLTYGPCTFSVSIAGTAVDLITTVEPFLVTLGESAELTVTGGDSASGYVWTPDETLDDGTSATPTATPEETTTYVAESTIGDCAVTSLVTITVGPPIIIYDAFTPNGDLINDGWVIQGIYKFEGATVNVYDRWGQKVFESLGYGAPWDGTNRGKFLPTGPYYYVIELNSPDVSIPPITGVVSIIH